MASGREPKVVIISTEYVETDAASFKSVVQELTGKDSIVTTNSSKQPGRRRRSRFYEEMINKREGKILPPPEVVGAGSRGDSILMKDSSFKEFETLFKETPPMDDLSWNIN